MKNFLIIFSLFFGLTAFAQVGIGTTDPQTSLDVRSTAEATTPDGVKVPALTATALAAKDAAYTAAQDGALVFVSEIPGTFTPAGKTINVTAKGFYYYDSSIPAWVGVGGSFENPDVTNNGRLVQTITANTDYSSNNETFFELSTSGGPGALTITLPNPANNVGRIIAVMNNGPKAINVSNAFEPNLNIISTRSTAYISDGVYWIQTSN